MTSGVTQATLDRLARQLNDIASQLPTTHSDVDPRKLTDDIALLAHHLTYASERAEERFAAPETVHLPERHTLVRLAEAMAAVTRALGHLTEALNCASTGFYREAIPEVATSHLRGAPRRCESPRPRSATLPGPSWSPLPHSSIRKPAAGLNRPGWPRSWHLGPLSPHPPAVTGSVSRTAR
ncbi:hypothetical protein [Streptomyces sp. YS-3]|uniref:hypothetical protein n=1 Tax=Streptomyces sp. YS-3 TaxID=3381352 RepID=UPI00386289F1